MELLDLLNDGSIAFVADDDEYYRVDYWVEGEQELHVHDEDTGDEMTISFVDLLAGEYTLHGLTELNVLPAPNDPGVAA